MRFMCESYLDGGGLTGGDTVTTEGLREIHRRLCAQLPDEMLWVTHPTTGERVRWEAPLPNDLATWLDALRATRAS